MPDKLSYKIQFGDTYGVVNPAMLHAHLTLLRKFKMLEQSDKCFDARYLLRAQERYVLWLDLLRTQNFDQEVVPIPPLVPVNFIELLNNFYSLIKYEIWESNGSHIDPASERIWTEKTKQPWVLNPNDSSDFKITCPWCKSNIHMQWEKYVKLMQTSDANENCPICYAQHSIETLSAKRFIDDISAWNKDKSKLIGGTLIDRKDGSYSEELSIRRSQLLFTANIIDVLTNCDRYEWVHITEQLNLQIKNVKEEIIQRVISAYSGIPLPFSIDLVSAVHRQRRFTEKIVKNKWIDRLEVQENSITRYLKFLSLIKEKSNIFLVPTFDIDLCWHTHQLHASFYRSFTKKHIGRIINHDDTSPKELLLINFEATAQAWNKKYHEPYALYPHGEEPCGGESCQENCQNCQQCRQDCDVEACYCD
ncbi:8634_t:CDS:2 [Racocetra persica]|uniref:8634_t:CDS:1 n=1 Tax=Racocetra persica TaxID=160502 RepID=A0ACA9NHH2_9GLOM|nr:8634_t:CDS:2 [Racocetra persica]